MDNRIEDLIERIAASWFELGVLSGMESIVRTLREESGTLFSKGKDKEAILLRNTANKIYGIIKSKRRIYDECGRPRSEEAWGELEKALSEGKEE